MVEFEFKPGDAVAHEGDVWVVESARAVTEVTRGVNGTDNRDEKGGYRIIRLRWCGDIYEIERKGVAACEVSALTEPEMHELTAAEYVEKLKAVFGRAATVSEYDKDQDCCYGMKCDDCPFGDERLRGIDFCGNCDALVWYHPEKAVKLMDEWLAEREKKKTGKTYLEDFREKFPNSAVNAGGRPGFCRKRLYGSGDLSGCEPGIRCEECWNTVMPEVEDNAEG